MPPSYGVFFENIILLDVNQDFADKRSAIAEYISAIKDI